MTELQKEALQNTSQTVIDCYDFMDAFASCGVTDILQTAERRGAQAVGITISEKQVGKCKVEILLSPIPRPGHFLLQDWPEIPGQL